MKRRFYNHVHQRLSKPNASWPTVLLGLLGGLSAAVVIISFLHTINLLKALFFAYTGNQYYAVVTLPILGAIFILITAFALGLKYYRLGIPFVIHRLKFHDGMIPLKNTINQFIGASVALASGFVVGREGPAVHLGAAGSSWLGHWLGLPKNATRTLASCGIAAGIAASFNTPLAAVIFVMEVVLREYKLHTFVPVMMASACGTVVHRLVFTTQTSLANIRAPHLAMDILPLLLILGIVIGLLAVAFNRTLIHTIRLSYRVSLVPRLLVAAGITAALTAVLPNLAIDEHATFEYAILHNNNALELSSLLAAKFFACALVLGFGIPGGVIGPLYALGILAAAVTIQVLQLIFPIPVEFYHVILIIGMGSMMGATLHAPLAALVAILELTNHPEVVLPAMVAVIPAYLIVSQLFRLKSIFIHQMELQGLPYERSPVETNLQRIGVLSQIDRNWRWQTDEGASQATHQLQPAENTSRNTLRWRASGDTTWQLIGGVDTQATLADVYLLLKEKREGAVFIYHKHPQHILGIISWEALSQVIHSEI